MLTPPCVTRWSGGAVSHHRRIAAAAGAAKQLIMLLNLEVNITAGSLTSCPGRFFFVDAGVAPPRALLVLRAATCCRRARRAFCDGGGAAAARRRLHCSPSSAAWLLHGRSGSYRLLGLERTRRWCSSYRRDAVALASFARLLCSKFLPRLASVLRAASSKF